MTSVCDSDMVSFVRCSSADLKALLLACYYGTWWGDVGPVRKYTGARTYMVVANA